ncbi:MAG: polyhydroxybutyrate depolymerase [Gaiellaceae bacterium]|jgi:poly(3-hydroxybutyrate) depolymerase|nr:polyhydroxybutyrate depolymerase [Gaiellaceae bacterium]
MRLCILLALALALVAAHDAAPAPQGAVRTVTFSYRSHAGTLRTAYVVLPAWYGKERHPAIPLVISPHGRGVSGSYNLRFWGDLPARGPFALVSPDGQGRKLPFYSWGYARQIDDLARMPAVARKALPWLRVDPRRIYAIGDSMGGQEVLLLAAHSGIRLAGVAAFDPVTSMAARYRVWHVTPGEEHLPALARVEFGGTPKQLPRAYAARSPDARVRAIARSGIPTQLWWSHRDSVVTDQTVETAAFFDRVVALAPSAPVQEVVGYWEHAREMHPETQLPAALACFGLVDAKGVQVPAYEVHARGTIEELPPERNQAPVAFSSAFCGRSSR